MATTPLSAIDAETVLQAQELVHVGTWVADLEPAATPNMEKAVVRWSAELWRMMRLEPNSVPMSFDSLMQFVHEDDRERIARIIGTAASTGIGFQFDYRVVRADGVERVVHARGNVQCDDQGRVVRLLGTASDITDRVRAEEAREASETRFRAVFEQAAVGIAIANRDHEFVTVNESFAALLGHPSSYVVGKSFEVFTHPDDAQVTKANLQRALTAPTTYEKRYLRPNGQGRLGSSDSLTVARRVGNARRLRGSH